MAIINNDIETWKEYKIIRNQYNNLIKKNKNKYFEQKLDIKNKIIQDDNMSD